MIYELCQVEALPLSQYQLCIIGSGPAGATVANLLADSGYKICVLESGGHKPEKFTDDLREVENAGILIKSYSRERVVGGTSTTWSGLSSPLDAIDFQKRVGTLLCWPIERDDLIPYYIAAADQFRFPTWEKFKDFDWLPIKNLTEATPNWQELEEKIFIAPDSPQNYGKEFQEIYKRSNVDLYTGCTVTQLGGCSETGRAQTAIVRSANGKRIELTAKIFVLACGGIENPRLLLNSRFACAAGLGNDRDQVGRYFMNHPKNNYGVIQLNRPIQDLPGYFGFLALKIQCSGYIGLRIKQASQKQQEILNSYIRFEPVFGWSGRASIESLNYFTKRSHFLLKGFKHLKQGKLLSLRDYSETGDDSDLMNERKNATKILQMLGSIAWDFPVVVDYLRNRFSDRHSPKVHTIHLRNFMEMAPSPENRITLSDRRDAFGMQLPQITHQPGELDKRSMAAVHRVLAKELTRTGWGKLVAELRPDLESWPIDLDASHHMGATRMGDDPASSVVNPQCRLYFSPNVYLAGASVFPTSGSANPTFTVVALAIRLAQHLKYELAP